MTDRMIRPVADFYVYLHRRATDGSVFYVGKGTGRRAKKTLSRSKYWQNIVARHGFVIEYVITGVQEWYALELERELIAYYGREILCNLTEGGDGVTGMRHGDESRRAISRAMTGRKRSAESVAKGAEAQRGRAVPIERRQAISETLRGRRIPPEVAKKIGQTHRGMKRSEETKERMRQSWSDPQRRAERSAAMAAASWNAKKVRCIETGEVFDRISLAGEWLFQQGKGATRARIGDCCMGKRKTACGFHWEYAD